MRFNYKNLLYAICSLLIFLLTVTFKSIPTGQLWKGYSMLYVPAAIDDFLVKQALSESEITEYASLYDQYLPVNLSANSAEISMLKINAQNKDFEYSTKRNAYFYDKSKTYRVYYIPAAYKAKISKTIEILNAKKIECGADANSVYPWILPVIFILFALFLTFNSYNPIVFSLAAFPLELYILCNPFYPVAVASCLCLLFVFYISNIWRRKGAVSCLINRKIIFIMILCAIVCAFACSVKSGMLFILTLAGIYTTLKFLYQTENYFENKKSFIPVFIRPAKMVSVYAEKPKKILPMTCSAAALLMLFFVLTSSDSLNTHFSSVQLPAARGAKSENLPGLNDYYDWLWNVKSYPYRSLNSSSEKKDFIEFPRYIEDGNKITKTKDVMAYNQTFKTNAWNDIDKLKFESIEKVMKNQGKDFSAGYASSNSYTMGFFSIIMMITSFFILLFICISIIITKSKRR